VSLIEKLIEEFLASKEPTDSYLKKPARKYGFLPLECSWTPIIGIRSDGSFVSWDDDDKSGVKVVTAPREQRVALWQGAKRFPELRALLPERPAYAITCTHCNGTGELPPMTPQMICYCGGAGWLLPGELGT